MARMEVDDVLKDAAAEWQVKDHWACLYREAYELVMPGINPYAADRKKPQPADKQFDSTATKSAVRLANRLLNELTPPDQNWIDVKTGPALDLQLREQQKAQINQQLTGVSTVANMVVNQGDMVDARGIMFLDLVISGTGVLLDLEDMSNEINPMISTAVPQAEVAVRVDARGKDVGFFRKRMMKIRDIEGNWSDVKLTDGLKKMLKDKQGDKEIEIHEVTYRNPHFDKRGNNDPEWYYEVICITGDGKKGGDRIVERAYHVCPWSVFRWVRLPGVAYGPGPVLLSLADIRTANKIVEMILKNAALALAGMWLVKDDGVLNPENIMLQNGLMIPCADPNNAMKPLETGRNFEIGQLVLEQFQERIRAGLYDDSLREKRGNPRSAQEIIQLVRDLTQDIGSAIGRLTSDTVAYGRKVVDILVRQGFIPFKVKIDQFTLKMQINSPLANAAQLREVENVIQWLQTVISLGGEQLAMVVAKLPEIMIWIADRLGVPMMLTNNEQERKKIQQDMAQIASTQMQGAGELAQAA